MAKNTTIRPKGYMTPNEVGELLGVTGDKIKYWIKRGKLKGRRTPNGFYWVRMEDALKAFIEIEGKTPSPVVHIECEGEARVIDCSGNGNGKRK